MSRVRSLYLAVALVLAAVVLVAAPAQAATYTLRGVVRDASGAPVAGIGVDWRGGGSTSLTETATTTAADGSYVLSVPGDVSYLPALFIAGRYLGNDLYARTESFQMSGDRVVDATLPLGAVARVTVLDGRGAPVGGAPVMSAERFALTSATGGLSLVSRFDRAACVTSAAGVCAFDAFRGGSIEYFDVTVPNSNQTTRVDGMDTLEALNDEQLVLDVEPVAGAVRASDGTPVSGATVTLARNGVTQTTTSSASGQFSFNSLTGRGAVLTIAGTVAEGVRSGPFSVKTSSFTIAGPRNEVVTLPPLGTLAVHVEDSLGAPVQDARVGTPGSARSERAGTTSSGLDFVAAFEPGGGYLPFCDRTDDHGACVGTVFRGGTTPPLLVLPREGFSWEFPVPRTDEASTTVTARLSGYAFVASAGTQSGSTLVRTQREVNADINALDSSKVVLPDGMEAIVGRISYEVAVPVGGSTTLRLGLPSFATEIVTAGPDGRLRDVTADNEEGELVDTVPLTDGSADDEDGTVNGVITGSVIPVRRDPLAVTTDSLPSAAVGHEYRTTLVGTGPVPPYTWTLTDGTLPDGLTLAPDGTISGTSSTLGSSTFEVTMSDSTGWRFVAHRTMTLTVANLAVATPTLPDADVGRPYRVALKRVGGGGTASWRIASGVVPAGMSFTSAGVLSGTPRVVGSSSFNVVVTSGGHTSPYQRLTLVVRPMTIGTTTLPAGRKGAWYSAQLAASGGKPTLTWSLADGSLPTGLRLGAGGRITGYPKAAGTWTFTVRLTDASTPSNIAHQTLSITVL